IATQRSKRPSSPWDANREAASSLCRMCSRMCIARLSYWRDRMARLEKNRFRLTRPLEGAGFVSTAKAPHRPKAARVYRNDLDTEQRCDRLDGGKLGGSGTSDDSSKDRYSFYQRRNLQALGGEPGDSG